MNAEQKKMYLTETTLVLNREGFHAEILHGGKLGVWLDDEPLCEISDGGAVHYHSSDIPSPERIEAKDKAYQITCTVFEYMRMMESAPPLKAVGLEDQYKLLAEFNGTVLAGMHSQYGVQFVTWERDHAESGLHWDHYLVPSPNRKANPSPPMSHGENAARWRQERSPSSIKSSTAIAGARMANRRSSPNRPRSSEGSMTTIWAVPVCEC